MQSNSALIHQRYLRFFMTEIYKIVSQANHKFMWLYFIKSSTLDVAAVTGPPLDLPYNFKNGSILNLSRIITTYYDTNASHFRRDLTWNKSLAIINSVIHYMNLKEKLKIIKMFIADIWYGSNQLLCNLYTVHVIFYLFDNHVILLDFFSQGYYW